MGLPLQTKQYLDNGGGIDLKSSPTKVSEKDASDLLNTDYSIDGAFFTRNGSTIMNVSGGIPAQMSGGPSTLALYDYRNSTGAAVQIVCAGSAIKQSLVTPTNMVTGVEAAAIPDMEFQVTLDDEYLFWGNGDDENLKFNGTTWTNWSLPTPTAPSGVDHAAGTLSAGDYYYYVSFARTVGGIIVQENDLSPISSVVTIAGSRQIRVTIPVCNETLLTGVTAQCNARVLYRISPSSSGEAYRHAIIADNSTTTYDDNTDADGTIEAQFDNQPAPTTAIFEEFGGRMNMVDAENPTDLYESKVNKPWNVPEENVEIYDGPIKCLKRIYGVLFIATDRSLWIRSASMSESSPRRISSFLGVLNNRCAVGDGPLYIFASNKKIYSLSPTDFSQEEIRIEDPISTKIEPLLASISPNVPDSINMEYYSNANTGKVMISCPIGSQSSNTLVILNETQTQAQKKPVWQIWDNINASAMKLFTINGEINLYSGDYNGFLWKLDSDTTNGDGAEENGTVTSSTSTTITDSTKSFTVNSLVGKAIHTIDGTGADQSATVTSNTSDTITFGPAFSDALSTDTVYTVGGYDAYHFTNWKSVTDSYDTLKQLWFFITNMNASGDYPVTLIVQFDFNNNINEQTELNINLSADNTVWGDFLWGGTVWGSFSVFQDRLRIGDRFRAVRFGIRNRKAGQPFQCNGFSVSVQDKGLFYRAA